MDRIAIDKLLVLHRLKDAAGNGMDEENATSLSQSGFFLDTCLRQLTVMLADDYPANLLADSRIERLTGEAAYSFLLQTATGLNSSIPGESNILGQFRTGWNNWRNSADADQVCRLNSHMHRLLADSRTIRRDYLEGIGGSSYGSLVRKKLQPAAEARILFVGTGKLTRSILTLFSDFNIALWNHRDNSQKLHADYRCFAPLDAAAAADWATHIVVTTPADELNDAIWARLEAPAVQHVVHLGRRRANRGVWAAQTERYQFSDLDDIFDLRRAQSSLRTLQILRARKACEQLARQSDGPLSNAGLPDSAIAQGI